jgi:hypothetical protein
LILQEKISTIQTTSIQLSFFGVMQNETVAQAWLLADSTDQSGQGAQPEYRATQHLGRVAACATLSEWF